MLKANRLLLLLLLLLSFTLAGCKGETKEEDNVIELTEEEDAQLSEDLQAQDALETIALESEPRWVVANGGLKMRENFNLDSKEIMVIPDGELVTAIERKLLEEEIAGAKGYWTKVNYQRENGWVFGGFLSEQAPNQEVAIDEKMLIGAWHSNIPNLPEHEGNIEDFFKIEENNVFKQYSVAFGEDTGKWEIDHKNNILITTLGNEMYRRKIIRLDNNSITLNPINLTRTDRIYHKIIDKNKQEEIISRVTEY